MPSPGLGFFTELLTVRLYMVEVCKVQINYPRHHRPGAGLHRRGCEVGIAPSFAVFAAFLCSRATAYVHAL